MCGIAGIVNVDHPPDAVAIERMINVMAYRGPDGSGYECFEEGVALGHRRLSILDISQAGRQPMCTSDGRYWVTYNGEIYNFVEIRLELETIGYRFRSGSDTEVLLNAYAEWGENCLQKFMGMFAFAIWDRRERRLFAARDRLGIKPFYYLVTGTALVFASEIKSILQYTGRRSEVDSSLIDAYMQFGYVPGEQTLHKGVMRLLPGHVLIWENGRHVIRPYWDLDFGAIREQDLDDAAADIKAMLVDSIRLHLRSDVPLGVFLSGGLDSSAVVSLLAESASGRLKTFSVAYDFGPEYDETCYAREVARRFSTDHHEIRVEPREFLEFVPAFIHHMDEPVTEAAAISLYYVSKLAREHVVVCLSGEGSDELFAGYDFYRYNLVIEQLRRLYSGTGYIADTLARRLRHLGKLAKYLRLASLPLEERYRGISSYDTPQERGLYSDEFATDSGRLSARCASFLEALFKRSEGWHPLNRMLYFDTRTWLVDDLLIKADRMSMATSIELRVPFLDHRLVERAAQLPVSYKIRGNTSKRVLKHALKNELPESILKRKKVGFPTPLEIMFRGELYDYAHELLLSEVAIGRGYFDRVAVRQLLTDHRAGRARNHRAIWQLTVLEEWHRRFAC